MENLKKWWLETARPWLQKNWQWVLFPIGILLFVLEAMSRKSPDPVTIDPTAAADERAKIEEETLKKQQAAERARLAEQERKIEAGADQARQDREKAQTSEVTALREDPEELKRRMLATGKP